jgi:serine/threonine protein kinase
VRTLGKYELIRRLSGAGMAEIYLGRQVGPVGFEKTVAIKRLHPHLAKREKLVRMFLSEARVAARLSHPNIGQIYELGHDNDEYFIAMEYIHGRRLSDVHRETKEADSRVPFGLVAHIVACLCRALHHAHTLRDELGNLFGLVHGDVSPDSVLLAFNGDVKLTDFGVAKATSVAAETQTGILKGKFGYMSPEQCRNEEADHRSDIFAAGILLFELTCGQHLFVRDSDYATVQAVIKGVIPPPSAVVDDVPDELEEIIMAALARDRDQRYQTAQEMQLALEAAIRANGWRTGPLALSRYVTDMFADKMTPATDLPRISVTPAASMTPTDSSAQENEPKRPLRKTVRRRRAPGHSATPRAHVEKQGRPTASVATIDRARVESELQQEDALSLSVERSQALRARPTGSAVRFQEEVPTVDVPAGSREMRAPSAEFDRRLVDSSSSGPAHLEDADPHAPQAASAPFEPAAPAAEERDALISLAPDENMEGPTIIQPPDFDDLDLGATLREPPPDYWDAPEEAADHEPEQPIEADFAGAANDLSAAEIALSGEDSTLDTRSGTSTKSRRWLLWLTAVLLVLLVGVGATIGMLLSKQKPAHSSAQVTVRSSPPGATVYIDGKEFPKPTPLVLKDITPGQRHWLVITRDGYRTATRRFVVKRSEHHTIDIALEPGKTAGTATVRLESEPSGATVYLDGTKYGTTPISLDQLKVGTSHELVVRKTGFEQRQLAISGLEAGERRVEKVTLNKAAPPPEQREDGDDAPVVVPQGRAPGELGDRRPRTPPAAVDSP